MEKHLIEGIKKWDEKTVQTVYDEYRQGFILFAKRYEINEEKIIDIYQDAVIALCENADKGHLDELKSSVKTYLFAIGKYMIFNYLRKRKQKVDLESLENLPRDFEWLDYSEAEENKEIQSMRESFNKLGPKCQEILKLFYYQERNLDEITEIMKYENKDVAKSQKSRCLKQLRQFLTNR